MRRQLEMFQHIRDRFNVAAEALRLRAYASGILLSRPYLSF